MPAAAVENLTRWLAVELARTAPGRARVNAVAPGFFVGEQNRALLIADDGTLTERGAQIVAFHRHAVTESRRRLKPSIPERGRHGIPIAHELELELRLQPRPPKRRSRNDGDDSGRAARSELTAPPQSEDARPSLTETTPQEMLDALDVLVGEWSMVSSFAPSTGDAPRAQTTFEWLPGGRFLVQRWAVDHPDAPDGIAIIGFDPGTESLRQHYFDSRGVTRVYEMTFAGKVWTLERSAAAPDFSQRFTATLDEDGDTIVGRWELSRDGSTWNDLHLGLRVARQSDPLAREPWRSLWSVDAMRRLLTEYGFSVRHDRDLLDPAAAAGSPTTRRKVARQRARRGRRRGLRRSGNVVHEASLSASASSASVSASAGS